MRAAVRLENVPATPSGQPSPAETLPCISHTPARRDSRSVRSTTPRGFAASSAHAARCFASPSTGWQVAARRPSSAQGPPYTHCASGGFALGSAAALQPRSSPHLARSSRAGAGRPRTRTRALRGAPSRRSGCGRPCRTCSRPHASGRLRRVPRRARTGRRRDTVGVGRVLALPLSCGCICRAETASRGAGRSRTLRRTLTSCRGDRLTEPGEARRGNARASSWRYCRGDDATSARRSFAARGQATFSAQATLIGLAAAARENRVSGSALRGGMKAARNCWRTDDRWRHSEEPSPSLEPPPSAVIDALRRGRSRRTTTRAQGDDHRPDRAPLRGCPVQGGLRPETRTAPPPSGPRPPRVVPLDARRCRAARDHLGAWRRPLTPRCLDRPLRGRPGRHPRLGRAPARQRSPASGRPDPGPEAAPTASRAALGRTCPRRRRRLGRPVTRLAPRRSRAEREVTRPPQAGSHTGARWSTRRQSTRQLAGRALVEYVELDGRLHAVTLVGELALHELARWRRLRDLEWLRFALRRLARGGLARDARASTLAKASTAADASSVSCSRRSSTRSAMHRS